MKQTCLSFLLLLFIFSGAQGQPLLGVKIYVNPGHGGYDSDDRNVVIPPFAAGNRDGFWESKSNLVKGLYLRTLLEAQGAQVIMSRVDNRTVDDRSLSAIAEEANANRADFMISIHSNAFNSVTNYPLMLFHGWDNSPILKQSMEVANHFWDNLISNQITTWSYKNRNVRGDKSFAPASWDGYGVLRPLTVPGLISEGSFHDYLPETYRLMNDDYKQLEAWHHFRAFCLYYGGNPGKKGKIAGFVKDSASKVTQYATIVNSKDQWRPLNGAKVTLQPGNLSYLTDNLNNGFFIFDNLDPGMYRVTFEADQFKTMTSPDLRVDSAKVTYIGGYLTSNLVGIQDIHSGNQQETRITVFPNPALSFISFKLDANECNVRYHISDLSGRTLQEGDLPETSRIYTIDIQQLSRGTYILNLMQNEVVFHGIFLKL
jgi:N-acetylmuramoyl-L-alanine amidase